MQLNFRLNIFNAVIKFKQTEPISYGQKLHVFFSTHSYASSSLMSNMGIGNAFLFEKRIYEYKYNIKWNTLCIQ